MNLPAEFVKRMQSLLGDAFPAFEAALQKEPPVSLRLNRTKLPDARPSYEPVAWCGEGYYLPERPAFTFDPRLHSGAYYVQEASSMFLSYLLRRFIDRPVRFLDLCAAPGGKSTVALDALPAGSLVVCNETVRTRANVLAENIVKWGNPFAVVTNNTAADFGALHHYFDALIVDAPCSGEGMFRKDEQAVAEWSPAQVGVCAERQRAILADVWDALRPGGLLFYSTCTYNREENEDTVSWLRSRFGAEPLTVETPAAWGIFPALTDDVPACRFMPHGTRGEGLFVAVLRKAGSPDECERDAWLSRACRKNGKEKSAPLPAEMRSWLTSPEAFAFEVSDRRVVALPAAYAAESAFLCDRFRVLHRGIPLAERKGREWQPEHALALSTCLDRSAFDTLSLTSDEAIAYLRRESLFVPSDRRGLRLILADGLPLGWGNHLGNRLNNLYPQEWRIRSGYRPEKTNLPVW